MECRLPGGMGDDDENASSCNDGDCAGDSLLGAGERRPDVSSDWKTAAAATAWDTAKAGNGDAG